MREDEVPNNTLGDLGGRIGCDAAVSWQRMALHQMSE